MNKAKVVINVAHSLMAEQVELLNEKFGNDNWERFDVPTEGWTLNEQREISDNLNTAVVFASPLPVMVARLSFKVGASYYTNVGDNCPSEIFVFHNDKREKKQFGNKIVYVVAQEGWQLV